MTLTPRGFVSELLDLSRLPAPELLRDVDYATIKAERLAMLQDELNARGIPYDVSGLETDPFVILEENDAHFEMLDKLAINDAGRARMLAFARGSDLDHLAALFGVVRLAGELDDRLRRRVHLAPDAYGAAGSEGGYIYWAMTADVRVSDAVALGPGSLGLEPGHVRVAIATQLDEAGELQVLDIVRATLFSKEVKPLTDILSVKAAKRRLFDVYATIEIPRGPDPAVVLATSRSALDLMLQRNRRIGKAIAASAFASVVHVAAADRVTFASPIGDVVPAADEIAICREIKLTTRIGGSA